MKNLSGVSPIIADPSAALQPASKLTNSGIPEQPSEMPSRQTEPFAMVPHWLHDPATGLKDRAIRVYCALTRKADLRGKVLVSHATLAAMTGKSDDTVARCISELEKAGALIVVRSRDEARTKNKRNVYFLVTQRPRKL